MKRLRDAIETAVLTTTLCLGIAVIAPIWLFFAIQVNGPLFRVALWNRVFSRRR